MSDMVDILKQRLRLIPLLVVVASLAFVVRIGDAALQFRDLSGSANAQEAARTVPPRRRAIIVTAGASCKMRIGKNSDEARRSGG